MTSDEGPKHLDTWGRVAGKRKLPELESARREFAQKAREEIPRLVQVHKAWMVAMVQGENLDRDAGRQILGALMDVDIDEMIATYDRRFNKPILQLERYLADKIGPMASNVLAGRTLPPPLYRMKSRDAMLPLIAATLDLCKVALDVAEQHTSTVMPGYTHLSHAQPMTYGHYLVGFHDAAGRASRQIEAAFASTNLCNMGCGALAGTSFNINRKLLADLLGFDRVLEHSNDCVAATDFVIDLVAALTNLLIPISRVANELDVWTTFEAGMFEIDDEIADTSSLMPQKKNACICEHLRATLGTVMGYYTELACQAHNTSYGDTMEVMFVMGKVPQMAGKGAWACGRMAALIKHLSAHEDVMLRHASEGFSTASELAAVMLREKGTPWRVAHAIVADVVRRLSDRGQTAEHITTEVIDAAAKKVTGEPVGLSTESIQSAIDPALFVEAMASQGGTAPDEVQRMIDIRRDELECASERQTQRQKQLKQAERALEDAVARIVTHGAAESS